MKIKNIFKTEYFRNNKKTVICFIIGILGILLIFVSEAFGGKKQTEKKTESGVYVSFSEETEQKLSELISKIEGAGKTRVFLTIEESEEYVYAQNYSSDSRDLQKTSEKEYVIVDGDSGKNGLLIKTVNPKVRGIAVVCEGGDDPVVQQRIYSCISASLGISTARISISKMSSLEVKNEK